MKNLTSEASEYLFLDSAPIAVCHNRRKKRHRVLKSLAAKGKSSTGFFFGFKLHRLFNCSSEVVRLVTTGNKDDRSPM